MTSSSSPAASGRRRRSARSPAASSASATPSSSRIPRRPENARPAPAATRRLGHQLHRDGEREHRAAVDAVIVEVAVAAQVEGVEQRPRCAVAQGRSLDRRRSRQQQRWRRVRRLRWPLRMRPRRSEADRPAWGSPPGRPDSPVLAPITTSASPFTPRLSSSFEHPAALVEPDQGDAAARELLLEQGRDHPGGPPRPPVDRDHPCRPAAVELVREPAEHLAGGGVVGLTAVPEASRDRAEQDQEAQATRAADARPGCARPPPWPPSPAPASRAPCRRSAGPRSRPRRGSRRRCVRGARTRSRSARRTRHGRRRRTPGTPPAPRVALSRSRFSRTSRPLRIALTVALHERRRQRLPGLPALLDQGLAQVGQLGQAGGRRALVFDGRAADQHQRRPVALAEGLRHPAVIPRAPPVMSTTASPSSGGARGERRAGPVPASGAFAAQPR